MDHFEPWMLIILEFGKEELISILVKPMPVRCAPIITALKGFDIDQMVPIIVWEITVASESKLSLT